MGNLSPGPCYTASPMPTATAKDLAPLSWASLNILTKKRYDFLLSQYGNLENAWEKLNSSLLQRLGCKEQTIERILKECNELAAEETARILEERGITFLTIEDEAYPPMLKNIADPPVFLFALGNLSLLSEPSIALVGTRDMSAYGKRVVQAIVPDLVHAGLITVSGLALGIDAEVAKETMRVGGRTIAVLGHGLQSIYPRKNAKIAEEILKNEGLLLTEYPLHTTPDTFTFPARNRIIAGLSLGTVVIEAASQSGSLITASLALDYGREVFAVPGQIFDPHFEGTHELIAKSGAKLVQTSADILRELGVIVPEGGQGSHYRPQTPDEKTLLTVLTTLPQSIDDLVEKTELTVATLNATLTLMELKGGAKNVGSGMWVKA